jgi:hypothetical protein
MFAREAVANSWDAYWDSEQEHQDFEIIFRFRTLDMGAGYDFRKAADIGALADRIHGATSRIPSRHDVGLSEHDCLDDVGPIRVLEVVERWGGGMSGNWDAGDSALERALIKVGWAQSKVGAGGSFGYGKAAVAQGSRINSIIAYSCFPESEDDIGVTRRLLGATYWRPHHIGRDKFDGFAIFGQHDGPHSRPLENADADAAATAMGLAVRDPESEEDWGTTLVVIDPSFDKEELVAALLCNWWPALLRTGDWRMHLFVTEDDEPPQEVEVEDDDPVLAPFVLTYREALDVLDGGDDNFVDAHEGETGTVATHRIASDTDKQLGAAALVEVAPTGPDRKSLVALMREHRMVVKYLEVGTGEPVVRGTFIADEHVNESLRQTEPPEHDRWLRRRMGDNRGMPEDYRRADVIVRAIERFAAKFRQQRTPPPPERRGWTPAFSGFFAIPGAAASKTPTKRPRRPGRKQIERKVHVHLVHPEHLTDIDRPTRKEGSAPESLRGAATVRYRVVESIPEDELLVEFRLGARIEEDGGAAAALPVTVGPPIDVELVSDGRTGMALYRGRLRKEQDLFFTVETADYDDEWTVDMFFDARVIEPTAGVGDGA